MFSRFMSLIKAMFNKGISKMETPELLAEEAQQNLESSVKKVQDAVVNSLTNEKMLEQQIKKARDEVAACDKRAAAAVQQNNDDLARQCLQKKGELNQNLAMLMSQLDEQKKNTAALKARAGELQEEMRAFAQKRRSLTARGQASDAVTKANELLSSSPGSEVARLEQKIEQKEYRSQALHDMGSSPVQDKFAELDKRIEIDDELAALKAQVSGGAPKLIVDQEAKPAKTVVDENVPMVIEPEDDQTSGKK